MALEYKGFYQDRNSQFLSVSPGTECEVVFFRPRSGETGLIKELSVLSMPEIPGAGGLAAMHHYLEFLLNVRTESSREHEALYRLFFSLTDMLKAKNPAGAFYTLAPMAHELVALRVLGFLPQGARCCRCGVERDGRLFFSAKENVFCCHGCCGAESSFSPLTASAGDFFRRALDASASPRALREAVAAFPASPDAAGQVRPVIESIFQSLWGGSLRSSAAQEWIQN